MSLTEFCEIVDCDCNDNNLRDFWTSIGFKILEEFNDAISLRQAHIRLRH